MPRIMAVFKAGQVLILVGKTGSGRTTQVAKEIVEDDPAVNLVLTQNRRITAAFVAGRIANELDVRPGVLVGLRYRGENSTSAGTRLDVLTDGMVLAMAKSDPDFGRYNVVIVDEVHGHTIATDLVLGLLKLALGKPWGSRLKVVIMSATIDQPMFLSFFPGAVLQDVPGGAYTVNVQYLKMSRPTTMLLSWTRSSKFT